MRTAGPAAVVAAVGLLLCAPTARAENVTVQVMDELGIQQEDEVIAVFAGGHLLGTLHVEPAHRFDSFEVSLPVGMLDYVLCGSMRRREADGHLATHRIDNAGRAPVRSGQVLRAYTLDDTVFALEAPDVPADVSQGPACDPAVS